MQNVIVIFMIILALLSGIACLYVRERYGAVGTVSLMLLVVSMIFLYTQF